MSKIESSAEVRQRALEYVCLDLNDIWLKATIRAAIASSPIEAVKKAKILLSLCQDYLKAVERENENG